MRSLIDFIYTLLIAAGVVLFVGLGIWTFYSGPKSPEYPNYDSSAVGINGPTEAQTREFQKRQQKFDTEMKTYEKANKSYLKKAAAIALGAGIIFYMLGMWLIRVSDSVGEGLALGGAFSGGYAAVQATIASFKPLVFGTVTVLLIMFILLAHFRIRLQQPGTKKGRI